MAAPCDQWNSRELIPPPTNFPSINTTMLIDGEHSHSCDYLKATLQSIYNGKDVNGSLLKGELITLCRFLYKNKNSQRSWKLYGLLVKLKKCLERLAETKIHSYAGTMLSAWDGSLEPSTPITNLPSRQMLEYLCVSLQGCTKLCVYLATLCEQAALIMIDTVHSGMFLSSNLVFLAIVSRVRVLICNFFKATVGWYDSLITGRSSLPSTNAEWLRKETELPTFLMEWLGEDAARLTLDVTSSKTSGDQSLLDRLFNTSLGTSLDVSMDTEEGGERKVTAVSQLPANTPTTVPDLGEKLSRADLVTLVMARSKQIYNQLNPQVSPRKEDGVPKRWQANARTISPPRKRRRTKDSGSWCQAEERQPLQDGSRKGKQKINAKGSTKLWHRKKWNIRPSPRYNPMANNSFTASSKKRKSHRVTHKAEGLASSILTTVTGKTGKVSRRNSVASQRIGSASRFRRSLSQESTISNHSSASQNPERGKRLQQHITKVQTRRKRRTSVNKNSNWNSLVFRNSVVSFTPRSTPHTAASFSQNVDNGSCRDPLTLSSLTTYGERKLKTSMFSIPQLSAPGTKSHSNRNSVYPEPAGHMPKASSTVAIDRTVPVSTSTPVETVSFSGAEPKLTKKRKLVKRLKKLKHRLLGKREVKGSFPNVPDNSLHYANQMNISQSSQSQIPQHRPYILPQHGDQYQHHQRGSKQQHHHHGTGNRHQHHFDNKQQYHHHGTDNRLQHQLGNEQDYHHHGSQHQHHHHGSQQQDHHQDIERNEQHSHQQAHSQKILPDFKHNLSHQMLKRKGKRGHNKANKNDKDNNDHDMDSIFASLL